MIARMAAPVVSVRHALDMIGSRPVNLVIGQELPENMDDAFRIVAGDLDLLRDNPRVIVSGYTGIFWRKKDKPAIRELHLSLDRYWEEKK